MGTKDDLAPRLSKMTGIDCSILRGENVHESSIAGQMSWAADRYTTLHVWNTQHTAFSGSLTRICHCSTVKLYGEGDKAFLRLQEEIIKHNDDHSIFAWPMASPLAGLLAPKPSHFKGRSGTVSSPSLNGREAFATTNRGLSISLEITPYAADTYLAFLDCRDAGYRTGIFLRRLDEDDQFARVNLYGIDGLYLDREFIYSDCCAEFYPRPMETRRIVVRSYSSFDPDLGVLRCDNLEWQVQPCSRPAASIAGPRRIEENDIVRLRQPWNLLIFELYDDRQFRAVGLGFDFDFHPICLLEELPEREGATMPTLTHTTRNGL